MFSNELALFKAGTLHRADKLFGCHYIAETDQLRFMLWSPKAVRVALVGEFNDWDETANIMDSDDGIFTTYIPAQKNGILYKYAVTDCYGNTTLRADPYAFHAETGVKTSSRVWNFGKFPWNDGSFRTNQRRRNIHKSAVSIYEVHIGSWRKSADAVFPWYRSVAEELAQYCCDMGYTHVELMPITEYPYDGSWGYQATGYFAPTSRYGTPDDFKYFVNTLHSAGIAVILDWVGAHFPRDSHALAYFDGTAQYERTDPKMASHPQWGTLIFDYSKPEVRSFLISSVCFFAEEYHIDGFRFDAVSSMVYLSYCREGDYTPNELGTDTDLSAISLLQEINTALHDRHCVTIAEESTAYPGVTASVADGGLGFSFKWDMGFMHDSLDYFELNPIHRSFAHDKLSFSMMYAFDEHFVLAFSHDEVVHGKKSMLDKMHGTYEEKFSSLRALYGYIFAHTGKKHGFMGSEFAQFIEWDNDRELDWFLLDYPSHNTMQSYSRELNLFYKSHPAMYREDNSWDGFEWLNVEDKDRSCIAFMRRADRCRAVVCVCNFTPVYREDFLIGLNRAGTLKLALNSDFGIFGGADFPVHDTLETTAGGFFGYTHSASIKLPPNSCLYYEFIPKSGGKKHGEK